MKQTFWEYEKPLLTVMIQTPSPEDAKNRIRKAVSAGAEAFGLQWEALPRELQTDKLYRELMEEMAGFPVYVTHYRGGKNKGKTDEELQEELLHYADLGGTLFDVMMDYFDPTPGEVSMNPAAIEKQMKLIDTLHAKGKEVLMSAHVLKFTPGEEVLKIALEQRRRGADVVKIVTYANTPAEEAENLKTITLLKEHLGCPFLFLCGGTCKILRRVGIHLGCGMSLCVYEHDDHTTPAQPLLADAKAVRDNLGF